MYYINLKLKKEGMIYRMSTTKKVLALAGVGLALTPVAVMTADASALETASSSAIKVSTADLTNALASLPFVVSDLDKMHKVSAPNDSVVVDGLYNIASNALYMVETDGGDDKLVVFRVVGTQADHTITAYEVVDHDSAAPYNQSVAVGDTNYISVTNEQKTTGTVKLAVTSNEVSVVSSSGTVNKAETINLTYFMNDDTKSDANLRSDRYVVIDTPAEGHFTVVYDGDKAFIVGNNDYINANELLSALTLEVLEGVNTFPTGTFKAELIEAVRVVTGEALEEVLYQANTQGMTGTQLKEAVQQIVGEYVTAVGTHLTASPDDTSHYNALLTALNGVANSMTAFEESLVITTDADGVKKLASGATMHQSKTDVEQAMLRLAEVAKEEKYSEYGDFEVTTKAIETSVALFEHAFVVGSNLDILQSRTSSASQKAGAMNAVKEWKNSLDVTLETENGEYITALQTFYDEKLQELGLYLSEGYVNATVGKTHNFISVVEGTSADLFLNTSDIKLESVKFNGVPVVATRYTDTKDPNNNVVGTMLQAIPYADGLLTYQDTNGVTHSTVIFAGKSELQKLTIDKLFANIKAHEPTFVLNDASWGKVKGAVTLLDKGYSATPDEVAQFFMADMLQVNHKGIAITMENFESSLKFYNSLVTAGDNHATVASLVGSTSPVKHTLDFALVKELYQSVIDFTASPETNKVTVKTLLPLLADIEQFQDTMNLTSFQKYNETKATIANKLLPTKSGTVFLSALERVYTSTAITKDAMGNDVVPTKEQMQQAINSLSPFISVVPNTVRELNNALYYTTAVADFLKLKQGDTTIKTLADTINGYLLNKDMPLPSNIKNAYMSLYDAHKKALGYTDNVIIDKDGTTTKPDNSDNSANLKENATNLIVVDSLTTGQVMFLENGSEGVTLEFIGFATAYKDKQTLTVTVDGEEYNGVYDPATSKWSVALDSMPNGKQTVRVVLKQDKLQVGRETLNVYFTSTDNLIAIKEVENALIKGKGSKKKLETKDYAALETYYTAVVMGAYPEVDSDKEDEKVFGLEAFEDANSKLRALGYSKASMEPVYNTLANAAVEFIYTVDYDYLNLEPKELPNISIESLLKVLNISNSKFTNVQERDLLIALDIYLADAKYDDYAEKAEEAINYLSNVTAVVANPTDAGIKAAKKLIQTDLAKSNTLRLYLEQILSATELLTAKTLDTNKLEDAIDGLEDLESTEIVESLLAVMKSVGYLKAFDDGKMTYDTYDYEEELETMNILLTSKILSDSNELYKSLKDRYIKILTDNGVDVDALIYKGDGTTKPFESNKATVTISDKEIADIIGGKKDQISITNVKGVNALIDVKPLKLDTVKATVGEIESMSINFIKDANGKGMTIKLDVEGAKSTTSIVDLGKINKFNFAKEHLDMSNNNYRIFRLVDGKKVPVLGKLEADGSYTIYTQYLGELIVEERQTQIADIGQAFNTQDIQDLVDRGILSNDTPTDFNPTRAITVGEITESLNLAFGAVSSDTNRIKEVLGSTVEDFVRQKTVENLTTSSTLTRENAAVVVTGLIENYEGRELSTTYVPYRDSTTISSHARTAVEKMYAADIMVGKGMTKGEVFDSKGELTKSEFTKLIRKVLVRFNLINE